MRGLDKFHELRLQDKLRSLSNPVCMNTSYKSDVLNILSSVKTLDGERVRGRGSELHTLCQKLDKSISGLQPVKHVFVIVFVIIAFYIVHFFRRRPREQ